MAVLERDIWANNLTLFRGHIVWYYWSDTFSHKRFCLCRPIKFHLPQRGAHTFANILFLCAFYQIETEEWNLELERKLSERCVFRLFVNLVSCHILHLSLTWWSSLLFLRSNWKLRMIMVATNEREGPRLPESLIGLALPRLMIPISESFVYLHLYFICIFGL